MYWSLHSSPPDSSRTYPTFQLTSDRQASAPMFPRARSVHCHIRPPTAPMAVIAAQHASQLTRVRLENLELQEQMQRTPRYEVEVATGTARGAGTDSGVFVDLVGLSGHHSGERQLTHHPGTSLQPQLFKRGSRECFMVCCADIGAVSVVLLRQDGAGRRPHWQPDWLRVRKVQKKGPLEPWTEFPLGTWLSPEKGLRTLSLRLEAGRPPGNWIMCAVCLEAAR